MTFILTLIGFIFAVSWLPFHLFVILTDVFFLFQARTTTNFLPIRKSLVGPSFVQQFLTMSKLGLVILHFHDGKSIDIERKNLKTQTHHHTSKNQLKPPF